METEVNVVKNLSHKSLLVMIKYIPHTIAFAYAIYTFLGICGIDCNMFGCFFHVSLATWIILYSLSVVFKYCYVHRLPIYYIGLNELITCLDYYLDIELDYFTFIVMSLLLSFSLIFGYTYYYLKMRDYKKFCRPKVKKNPQIGDVLVTLNCGLNLYVDDEDFSRIKKSFKNYSIVGNRLSRPGYIKIYSSTLDEDMIISPEDYSNLFEIKEIVGLKLILDTDNPALNGDIICQNSIINREIIFSYEDWLNLDESWDATDIYGVETFNDDDEVTEQRYVIMANSTTFIIKAEDYSKVSSEFEIVDTINVSLSHDYVEIAGIKWATMNVGANSVTDTGLYFQWGDTQGYTAAQVGEGEGQKYFTEYSCIYYDTENYTGYTKYNETDELITLQATDDAVTVAWGGNWRMPTVSEIIALNQAVDTEWTDNYQGSGVAGLICTDKTDSSKILFFPACGDAIYGLNDVGDKGKYWSSSVNAECGFEHAHSLFFNSDIITDFENSDNRYYGCSVRGILDE